MTRPATHRPRHADGPGGSAAATARSARVACSCRAAAACPSSSACSSCWRRCSRRSSSSARSTSATCSRSAGSRGAAMFDIATLLVGSLIVTVIAMLRRRAARPAAARSTCPSTPRRASRRIVKPILEVLAGIPSVVLGFFALTFINPSIVQTLFPERHGVQHARRRHRRRHPHHPAHRVDLRGRDARRARSACARRRTASGAQAAHDEPAGRRSRRRCRASSRRSSSASRGPSARRWSWPSRRAAPAVAAHRQSARPGPDMTAAMAALATGSDQVRGRRGCLS